MKRLQSIFLHPYSHSQARFNVIDSNAFPPIHGLDLRHSPPDGTSLERANPCPSSGHSFVLPAFSTERTTSATNASPSAPKRLFTQHRRLNYSRSDFRPAPRATGLAWFTICRLFATGFLKDSSGSSSDSSGWEIANSLSGRVAARSPFMVEVHGRNAVLSPPIKGARPTGECCSNCGHKLYLHAGANAAGHTPAPGEIGNPGLNFFTCPAFFMWI